MTSGIPAALATALADRYRIERELGHGGMATVYLATDVGDCEAHGPGKDTNAMKRNNIHRQGAKAPTPWRLGVFAVNVVFGTGLSGCGTAPQAPKPATASSDNLYLWTAAADSTAPDFLAVYDVRSDSGHYGEVVTTVPVGSGNNKPHHSEHTLAADRQLFVNGFGSGQSWIFDLREPVTPKIVGNFGDQAGYSHPHSFLRLANGNVLSTFQMHHDSTGMHPGGLVEMTTSGQVVRAASAGGAGIPDGLRPYSGVIVSALDRIVTTTTDMDPASGYPSNALQIWKLSTLELLHTITLPDGPLGDESNLTAEPRLLSDGRTVMVSTFNCSLYLLDGLDGATPSGKLVATFPRKEKTHCAIPVVTGHYWLVTVPSYPAVVVLDVSSPAAPREVSRAMLTEGDIPHWISLEPNTKRLVITGYGALANRALIANFDSATGALSLDDRFHPTVAGKPHGAVFSLP